MAKLEKVPNEIRVTIFERENKKVYSISYWENGKQIDWYPPTSKSNIFMRFASMINGFIPEKNPKPLD